MNPSRRGIAGRGPAVVGRFAAGAALGVVVMLGITACTDPASGRTPTVTVTVTQEATAPPAARPSSSPPPLTVTGRLRSASRAYDPALGGELQAVALSVAVKDATGVGTGLVSVAPRVPGTRPTVRVEWRPGVVDVWLSDLRPHADIVAGVRCMTGPIAAARFVFPPDDALVILRLTLRDPKAEPDVQVAYTSHDKIEIDVVP